MVSAITNNATPQPAPAPLKRDGDGDGDKDAVRRAGSITTRAVSASVSESTSADLKIVTQDGDVVTLHASQDSSATYTNVRSRGPNSRASYTSLEASNSQSLSFSVQGDLSDSELRDIQTLVQRVGGDLKSFLSGGPATNGRELSGLDALAGFQLDFQHTETATVATLVRRVPVQLQPATDGGSAKPAPAPVPVSTPPASDAAATTVTTPAASPAASDLLRRLIDAGRQSGMSFERTTHALGHVIRGLRNSPAFAKQSEMLDDLRSALHSARRGGDRSGSTSISTTGSGSSSASAPAATPDPSESPANAAPAGL